MGKAKYVAVAALVALVVAGGPSSVPVDGQGAVPPILVVLNPAAGSLSNYLPQILKTEGLHTFHTANVADISAGLLQPYRLVILAEASISAAQATTLATYVGNGGRLIAMRPDSDLYGLLGITSQAGTLTNRNNLPLSITIAQSGPGAGLYAQSLPFRGGVSQYNLGGTATAVATLNGGGGYAAVIRAGRTAAWAFDLARSVAYVRQGDPLDKNLDRDGQPAYRTNDPFFDRIDKSRVNVPHADIHMRLFVRVIDALLADSLPLPRLWYFPGTTRTMMVVTGDSHTSTLSPHTNLLASAESFGARVSIYMARYGTVAESTVSNWISRGHEVGLHPYFDPDGLAHNMPGAYNVAVNWWNSRYSFPYSPTQRHHSLEWTGWGDPALTMQNFGIRLDTSYYAWGPALNNPTQATQAHGYVNGSGQAMPFIQENGAVTPVYQLVTALTDEQLITGSYAEGMTVPQATAVSRQLVDESQAGFYAAITTQFHVDYYNYGEVGPWVDNTMAYAQSLQIPMWTSQRYLEFIEDRRDTVVDNVLWSANDRSLSFRVALPAGSPAMTMLVPATFNGDAVTAVAVDQQNVNPPQLVVNGRTMRAITLTRPGNGAARIVDVLYAVPTPALTVGDVAVIEGHAGTVTRQVPVTLSSPSSNTVTATYQSVNGTATQPGDYQTASGTVTFAPFQTSANVAVGIVGDVNVEANETFSITLSNANNATIEDGVGIVTITDDDAPPTIAITDAAVTEGNSGTTPATFTVSLSHASGNTVTVQYATANGTATAGVDYTAGSGTLTFNPGVTSLPITVAVIGETAAEPNETFAVNLSNPGNAAIGDPQGAGTITNDDSGTVTTTATFPVLAGGDDVNEEGTTLSADNATVWVGSGAAAATSFAGFRFANVTIPPGAVVQSARLEVRSASAQWLTTSFEFAMEATANPAPFSATSRPSQRALLAPRVLHTSDAQWLANTFYPLDDIGALVQAAINQAGWASGNALSLIVRGAGQNWARKFATAFEGGAAFAPRLVVTYSATQGQPQPSLGISDVTVTEGNAGITPATFTVSLSASSTEQVTVNYAATSGTATVGQDFAAASGTLTFAPGATSQTVTVDVLGDTTDEPNEAFTMTLSAPANATLGDPTGTGTITDDDPAPPTLSIADAAIAEGDSGTSALVFTVTLSAPSTQTVTATVNTANGTAQAGSDYAAVANGTVTLLAGATSQTVSVTINGDTTVEANETFTVTLSAPANATLADGVATGTITNDDTGPLPTLSIGDASVAEGNAGSTALVFTVTLSAPSAQTVTATVNTANVSALAGSDYTAIVNGTVTVAAGATSQTVSVPIVGDTVVEPTETFTVALSAPVNATLADGTATGTIVNDDAPPLPTLSIGDASIAEGNAGTTALVFTVTLSATTAQTVTATVNTANGTAQAGSDYTAITNGTVTIAPGTTSQTVSVPVIGDLAAEPNETFTVALTAPANATLADGSATGTITNDDAGPAVVTVTLQVAAGGDDVNEIGTSLDAGSGDVWLGNASSTTASAMGLRFVNVPIPAGATITSARLEVNASSTQWQRMAFQFGIEAVANSPAFTATSRPLQRTLLAPRVNHSTDAQWVGGTWYPLEEIATILQAAVAQPGWASGNAFSLVLRGTGQAWGRKFARGFEFNPALAPRLVVTFQMP